MYEKAYFSTFYSKCYVSIIVHFSDGRFGKLTDGGLGFTGLNPKTFIFDSLTLVCGSSGGTISWLYSQNNTKIGFGESTTYDNAELGLSWLVIKISKQGYYGCKAYNFFKEIGVFDPSLTTGEFSNSYF